MARNCGDDRRGVDDLTLLDGVDDQITIVTEALAAAAGNPTDAALDQLREAVDNLMRALRASSSRSSASADLSGIPDPR